MSERQRQAQRIRPGEPEPEPPPKPPSRPALLAVVAQWTGKEARALRTAMRMSLERFAGQINAGRSTVTDWEAAGDQLVSSWGMQAALDETLRQASDECKKRFGMLCEGNPNVWVSDSSGLNGNGDPTNRGDFLEAIGAALAASAAPPLEALERIAADISRPGRVDTALVASHESVADALAGLHYVERSDVLAGQVGRQADVLLGLLDRPMTTADRRRLESIAVASHVEAGLLAFNVGDRPTARRYFALAWDVVDDAGDDTLRARALDMSAVVHSPIESGGHSGNTRRAVALMRRAVHHARRADPATRAYAHRWLGLQLAAAGNERGFLASYEAGDRIAVVHGQPDGPGFLARYVAMTPEQVSNRGIGLVRVGRAEEAIDTLRPTLDPTDPRWTAIALTDIAAARVLQGDPEQACHDLGRALDFALDDGYWMGVERILGVRAQFPEPWADLAAFTSSTSAWPRRRGCGRAS